MKLIGKVAKADKQLVFGWASVADIKDLQGDVIEPEALEEAAYNFVMNSRVGGEMHEVKGVATLVESFFITEEKAQALGIDEGWLNHWWVGFKVLDADVWAKIKSGEYKMFSIAGKARKTDG